MMPEEPREFGLLLQRVREGSEAAAREFVAEYGPHILRVVRRKLNRELRSKFDSVDFVQAVWASFFAQRAELDRFDHPAELAAFLGALAKHKVAEEHRRRLQGRKYNVNREHSLDGSAVLARQGLAAAEPTPSEAVVAKETWDHLARGKPSHYRRVLALRSRGITQREIAAQLGLNEKTVQRIIQRLLPKPAS